MSHEYPVPRGQKVSKNLLYLLIFAHICSLVSWFVTPQGKVFAKNLLTFPSSYSFSFGNVIAKALYSNEYNQTLPVSVEWENCIECTLLFTHRSS